MEIKKASNDSDVLRLMDANINRCREGLRVLEDTARFVWNQSSTFHFFRRRRHQLDQLTKKFYPQLLAARNSQQDEGRKIKEGRREDLKSVVVANFRRCEEALRVLEEYGKLLNEDAGSQFKKMRFEIYALEKKIVKKLGWF